MGRPVEDLATRFERQVDRTGDHHLWLGSINPERGTGRIKVGNIAMTAHRVAWELAHGVPAPGERVLTCAANPSCVRVEHLRVESSVAVAPKRARRARKGSGSMRLIRPGRWELRVSIGRWEDGRPRSFTRTVSAKGKTAAAAALAQFVDEMRDATLPASRELRNLTVDDAMDRFLVEYLTEEKGRADKTITDYRNLHQRWFSPAIGSKEVRRIDGATIDGLFGAMRRAGLSASRLNQARSLYGPFFRWARRRGITTQNPMADFQLPTSSYRSIGRTPPEVEEVTLLLSAAVDVVPEIAPLLVLVAVTGVRRGELVAIRRSAVNWKKRLVTIDSAVTSSGKVKATKTYLNRTFHVDAATLAMLKRHCHQMDAVAKSAGVVLDSDPYLFSAAPDASVPLAPDLLTKRVATLKGYLGIEHKDPEVVALEDEALRLRRSKPTRRPAGRPGPQPKGGMSFREVAEALGRSERWASLAVASAERREESKAAGRTHLNFDGSILGLRKFTSSELLDAGFNVSVVAERQGHGPQVLTRHYSKSRASSDQRAAEHLGMVVHGKNNGLQESGRA